MFRDKYFLHKKIFKFISPLSFSLRSRTPCWLSKVFSDETAVNWFVKFFQSWWIQRVACCPVRLIKGVGIRNDGANITDTFSGALTGEYAHRFIGFADSVSFEEAIYQCTSGGCVGVSVVHLFAWQGGYVAVIMALRNYRSDSYHPLSAKAPSPRDERPVLICSTFPLDHMVWEPMPNFRSFRSKLVVQTSYYPPFIKP